MEAQPRHGVVVTAFIVIFLAEWGDLTQILTANLAAKYGSPLSVGVGSLLALFAVAAYSGRRRAGPPALRQHCHYPQSHGGGAGGSRGVFAVDSCPLGQRSCGPAADGAQQLRR